MKTKKVKTQKGKALDKLEVEFIKELHKINIELPKEASARIERYSLYLYIDGDKSVEIVLYPKIGNFLGDHDNGINFGCSGSFTPKDKSAYWRTITAASILKNWDKVCEIVNKYCNESRYRNSNIS